MGALLERARKVAQEAEVFVITHRDTEAIFEANRLKLVQTRETSGKALRIIKDGRIGFSASSRPGAAQELVDMALEMAPFGPQARFDFPGPQAYPRIEVYDPATEALPEGRMVGLGYALIDRVRGHTPELVCGGGVSRAVVTIDILNSRGGRARYQKSIFAYGLEGTLIRGTDMLFVGDTESSCHPLLDTRPVAETTLRQLEWAKETSPAPSGQLPVLFTPWGVASALITPLALGFNGRTVLQGASPIGHRLGEQVFDPRFSLWDDATLGFRPASRLCDDEGVPSRRTPLVEGGVVAGFLYDLQTAGQAGKRSTGNASRTLSSLPTPSVTALVVGEGEATFEELLAEIKDGLVVEQVMGASQGNVLAGEFSGNVLLGYRVQQGKVVGRVKNTMVSGNVYQALKEGVAFGRGGRWVGSSLWTPPIYCARLAVAAKG